MTRSDVEEIAAFIRLQLDRVEPGAHMEIGGRFVASLIFSCATSTFANQACPLVVPFLPHSYRRGKSHSSDVDLNITYPHEAGKERGVLEILIARLKAKSGLSLISFLPQTEPNAFSQLSYPRTEC